MFSCRLNTQKGLFLFAAALLSCSAVPAPAQTPQMPDAPVRSWQKMPDGLKIQTASGPLQIQVWSPDVVRVYSGSDRPSLAVTAKPAATQWRLQAAASSLTVITAHLRVQINRQTSQVRFLNLKGQVLLAEAGRKNRQSGEPLRRTAGDTAGPDFAVTQDFALPPDEDFYGLGQHQTGDMSYRGKSLTLLQQNRDVAVPFLVSSKGYGLLWDNPAVTRVDVGVQPATAIPAAQLFGEDGSAGGLTGRYYAGQNFDTLAATRKDAGVDFDWSETPPVSLPHDNYSVRWAGFLLAPRTGDYTLSTTADDGMRLWVDDKPVIEDWRSRAAVTASAVLHFEAGSRHRLRLEYYQNSNAATVRLAWSLPSAAPANLQWSSEAGQGADYYFVNGPSLDRVIAGYRTLTGQAPLPPKWALGLWQSKERYESQQELLDIVGRYRADSIPLDVIVQDWQYWSPAPWGSHEFNKQRYPDPAGLMRDLHAENAHLMISVWAKFDQGSANHGELEKAGALYSQVIPYVFPPGKGQWYDAFNPTARRLYWDQISRELFSAGIDGWWLDASEPELSGRWGEFRGYDTAAGPGTEVFNAYPMEHVRSVYEGQRRETNSKRVMTLTRSAYAGAQRYGAATWSGDTTAGWDTFAAQIPAGLNFCLSGIPYWTTDTGGFFVPGGTYPGGSSNPAYRELFTRWFEYSSFCPLFRVHGTDTPKELWRFGPETEKTLVKYDTLRYQMMPYLYSQAWQITHNSGTLMRALVMDFPNDRAARTSKDEFLFGPSLLVCPVIQAGATTRSVYLPGGANWFDFWTGKSLSGGRAISAAAPLDTLPLYVRAGSIVPLGPALQYATQKSAQPTELRIYAGANAALTLYEDAGDGYGYEKGQYAVTPLRWDDSKKTLTLGSRTGRFPGMTTQQTFQITVVSPAGAGAAPKASRRFVYRGAAASVKFP